MDARFWEAMPGGQLRCTLCHRQCVLANGSSGACRVRRNDGGRMVLPFSGAVSGAAIDPVEKKPLYHFMPGSKTYSVGYLGCNLHCPFCQNYHISQGVDAPSTGLSPKRLVVEALSSGCPSIAHTYSEPLVHAEFVSEALAEGKSRGLWGILVSNGQAGPEAARAVLENCDAANVDLKCWDRDAYRDVLGGELATVRAFIELALSLGVHLEVTTLVVPGLSDLEGQIDGIARYLAGLSPHIAYHLSAYRPMYRYREPATPLKLLGRLAAVARGQLRYVYTWPECSQNDTLCPSCGSVLVARDGWNVDPRGLSGSACAFCGALSPVKMA